MISIFDALLKTAKRDAKRRASKVAVTFMLLSISSLVVLVGLGFITAFGFLALEAEIGPKMTTLYFGLGFIVLAAIFLISAARVLSKPAPALILENPAAQNRVGAADNNTVIAFTAAFVLGRYLSGRKRR